MYQIIEIDRAIFRNGTKAGHIRGVKRDKCKNLEVIKFEKRWTEIVP